ncbi:glycoprotein 3-alpha-L-fucosyltransferase A-like [Watersipora subatra]|uniref:glycoprotein 3-alpha-L-fucosyltransferase A-like n=1 Tax=Watersipora subatra TaxID=2589382 RepID=UPI00355C6CA0
MISRNPTRTVGALVVVLVFCLAALLLKRDESKQHSSELEEFRVFDESDSVKTVKEDVKIKRTTTTPISPPSTKSKIQKPKKNKLILSIDGGGPWLTSRLHFDGCEYSNCDLIYRRDNLDYALQADALIFFQRSAYSLLNISREVRQRQLWFAVSMESPSYAWNRYYSIVNTFNGSMTYERNSVPAQLAYGRSEKTARKPYTYINYAKNKTKGAYAYVSNCVSKEYDRLVVMKQLKKYIDVDIFGKCTNKKPCPTKVDLKCEAKEHSQYRFYLAFENTLCRDYITEKFWKTLKNEAHIIPVAAGGLSVQEYTDVAPPDSFIHVYNFSSVETLGKYLKHLMTDDNAYNRYHEWRNNYSVELLRKRQTCGLCKAVNEPESIKSEQGRKFADERLYERSCKNLNNLLAKPH